MVAEQVGPAGRAKDVSEIDAAQPDAEVAPPRERELFDDLVPVDWVTVLCVEGESHERCKEYQPQNQLSFVQALSVSIVIFILGARAVFGSFDIGGN
jgi:hypothetical protein